jgi:uncharacterized phage infection (PIP) family protein YhgE
LFDLYEKDVNNLQQENDALRIENQKLVHQLNTQIIEEGRMGNSADYSLLVKKHTHLAKQYDKITRSINEKEQELIYLRKRERLFTVEKKMIEAVQSKNSMISHKLESKEDVNRNLNEQVKQYDRDNKLLKQKVKDLEEQVGKVTNDYHQALEQAALFKEMAVRSYFICKFDRDNLMTII